MAAEYHLQNKRKPMSSSNFLPFPVQENAHIEHRFNQQRRQIQALGMPMSITAYPFAYRNPYNTMLSSPPPFYCSSSRKRLLGVRRSNSMIHKLHQVRAWMRMACRFGIGSTADRRPRAPLLRNRAVVITRQMALTNHQVVAAAAFTCFQDKSTSNLLLERSDRTVEINDDKVDEKLKDIEDQPEDHGLDLRLKL